MFAKGYKEQTPKITISIPGKVGGVTKESRILPDQASK